jgi:hypothetical protein
MKPTFVRVLILALSLLASGSALAAPASTPTKDHAAGTAGLRKAKAKTKAKAKAKAKPTKARKSTKPKSAKKPASSASGAPRT